jgi:CRP-like cAMP-binding protein
MNKAITPESLKGLAFLATATDDELHQLAAVARIERHPAGAVLFREGDRLGHFYIVADGHIAIEIHDPVHRRRRIHTVDPGELLGWSPILGPAPMTATARALTDVRVVALDAPAVLELCDRDSRFGYLFMKRTAAAIAARLHTTRLQLLDVFGIELPAPPEGAGS